MSVVVPLYNEEQNVRPLVEAVRGALGDGWPWELILVDDGSTDGTADAAADLLPSRPELRLLRLARNYGQTVAMQAGFDHARGEVVVSMDGDLQNDPGDVPRLVEKIHEGYDLVAGYREGRKDRLLSRRLPSWIANRLIRGVTGVRIRDNGCSLKAYRGELVRGMQLYSDMHRFIPAVVAGTTGARIAEVPVRHHPRRAGRSKYGLSRVWKVLADLLTVVMIRWFRERPLVLFGWAGVVAGTIGVLFVGASLLSAATFTLEKARAVVFPGVALLWLGLAGYLLMLGVVAEVVVRRRRDAGPPSPASFAEEVP